MCLAKIKLSEKQRDKKSVSTQYIQTEFGEVHSAFANGCSALSAISEYSELEGSSSISKY